MSLPTLLTGTVLALSAALLPVPVGEAAASVPRSDAAGAASTEAPASLAGGVDPIIARPLPAGAVGPFYSRDECERARLADSRASSSFCLMYLPRIGWLGLPQYYYTRA